MKEDKPDPASPGYLRRRAEELVRWFSACGLNQNISVQPGTVEPAINQL